MDLGSFNESTPARLKASQHHYYRAVTYPLGVCAYAGVLNKLVTFLRSLATTGFWVVGWWPCHWLRLGWWLQACSLGYVVDTGGGDANRTEPRKPKNETEEAAGKGYRLV